MRTNKKVSPVEVLNFSNEIQDLIKKKKEEAFALKKLLLALETKKNNHKKSN
jgi:hypothetical protein